MKRLIFLLLVLFMARAAFGVEAVERQGTLVGEEKPEAVLGNATTSLKISVPGGDSTVIPPEVLSRMTPHDISSLVKLQMQKPLSPMESLFSESILVPLAVFSSAAVMVLIIAYFNYRNRKDTQDTIRLAIQSGQALPEGVMAALERKRRMPTTEGDLRKAVLLGCLGVGASVVLFVTNHQQPSIALLGLVPCILGSGYLFLWWQAGKTTRRLEHERA